MRVLVIGSDMPVGKLLIEQLRERDHQVAGIHSEDGCWKRISGAEVAITGHDMVVNTLVQSWLDASIDMSPEHVRYTERLAKACKNKRIPLLQLSSVYVFAGDDRHLYVETDEMDNTHPVAEHIIEAEKAVTNHCEQYLLLRLGSVFSPGGENVLRHMLRRLITRKDLHLSSFNQGCPLAVDDAVRVVTAMIDQVSCGVQPWGIYHYCSSDLTSCFEFAEVLVATASQYLEYALDSVRQTTEEEDPRKVTRELNCQKILGTFGITQQPWRASVAAHVQQVLADEALRQPKVMEV